MTYRPPTPKPCSACPFRRDSMPGWLGASSPEGFIDCMHRDEPLPCHRTINYEDPRWSKGWFAQETGSMCSGALTFMANKLQKPRTAGFPVGKPDKVNVFMNSIEFVRHHREAAAHSWDEVSQSEGAKLHREMLRRAAEVQGQPIVDFKDADKPEPFIHKQYRVKSAQPDVVSGGRYCGHTMDREHVCRLAVGHKLHHTDRSGRLHWTDKYWWHDTLK